MRLGKGIGKKNEGSQSKKGKNERGIKEREGGRVWRKLETLKVGMERRED